MNRHEPDDRAANAAEPAVKSLRQLTTTILAEFESSASCKISSLDATHAWCWRHASFIQQRFTRSQGQTPFEFASGRPYLGRLACFGEQSMADSGVQPKVRLGGVQVCGWASFHAVTDMPLHRMPLHQTSS